MTLTDDLKPAHPYVKNQIQPFADLEFRDIADAANRVERLREADVPFGVYEIYNDRVCSLVWPCVLVFKDLESGERMSICFDGESKVIACFVSTGLTNEVASSWIAALEYEIERELCERKLRPH